MQLELYPNTGDTQIVLMALKTIRMYTIDQERDIHQVVKTQLKSKGIGFAYEYSLGKRNRVDFLTSGGTAIEVKKKRPNRSKVLEQLNRYCAFEEVKAMILVTERSVHIPDQIRGIPCHVIGLNRLWGPSS